MIKVMFVCLGNICRSPLAEGIFKKIVSEKGVKKHFYADSSGTSSYHIGAPPDPRSIEVASKNSTVLDHRAQQLNSNHLEHFHYIIAMDEKNLADINILKNSIVGKNFGQIVMMRDFDDVKDGKDVPDPYFGEIDGFDYVYKMLWRTCTNFVDFLIKEHNIH